MPTEKKSTSGANSAAPQREPGHLDHHADLELDVAAHLVEQRPRGADLLERRDHREHDLQRVVRGDAHDRPQLGPEELGLGEAEADPATAEERVVLRLLAQERQRLVGARVERADHDRPPVEGLGDLGQDRDLLVLVRRVAAVEEEELGPQQPDALGALLGGGARLGGGCRRSRTPRPGCRRRARPARRRVPARRRARRRAPSRRRSASATTSSPGATSIVPAAPSTDERRAVRDREQRRARADHGGDPERAGEDRRVARGPAAGGRDRVRVLGIEPRRLAGRELVGEHDARLGRRDGGRAGEVGEHAAGDVLDVDGALAQVGVVEPAERGRRQPRRRRATRRRPTRRPSIARCAGPTIASSSSSCTWAAKISASGPRSDGAGGLEVLARAGARVIEPLALGVRRPLGRLGDLGLGHDEPPRGPDRDPGGRGHAAQRVTRRGGAGRRRFAGGRGIGGRGGIRRGGGRGVVGRVAVAVLGQRTQRVEHLRRLRAARARPAARRPGARRGRRARSGCGRRPGRSRAWRSRPARWRRTPRPCSRTAPPGGRAGRAGSARASVASSASSPIASGAAAGASSSSPSCDDFIRSAARASAATSARSAPPRARAAAATAPSTSGAAVSSIGPPSGSLISTASSALISALPRSISTSTPSGERTASTAAITRAASVPIAPSSRPPAVAIATSSPPISRASWATPSASPALCETMTRPTTAQARPAERASISTGWTVSTPVACSICQRQVSESQTARSDPSSAICRKSGAPTSIAMSYFSFFNPYVPAMPQQFAPALDDGQARDQRQQVERRLADPVPLLLARRVVGDRLLERREVGLELAALVQHEQVLADVEDAPGDDAQLLVVVHPEDLERLALEHQRAAGRRPDDVDALARVWREPLGEPVHDGARVVEHAVGLERQPAAVLLRDLDRDPVVLEQRDGHRAEVGLVVVRAAAVEERHLARQRGRRVLLRPGLERPAREARHGRVAVQPDGLLADQPQRACCAASSWRAAPPACPARPAQVGRAMIRSRSLKPVLLLEPRARLRVDLGDVDALRADLGADPAARAVVDRARRSTARRRPGSARPAGRRTSGPGTAA